MGRLEAPRHGEGAEPSYANDTRNAVQDRSSSARSRDKGGRARCRSETERCREKRSAEWMGSKAEERRSCVKRGSKEKE